jgi:hypothetical protein
MYYDLAGLGWTGIAQHTTSVTSPRALFHSGTRVLYLSFIQEYLGLIWLLSYWAEWGVRGGGEADEETPE